MSTNPTESPSPSPLRKSLEELALEAAEERISELEEAGFLDFDGGEQEDRKRIVENTASTILTALRLAVEQQEDDKRVLLSMCETLAGIGSLALNQPSEKHQQEWEEVLEEFETLRDGGASAMSKEAQG